MGTAYDHKGVLETSILVTVSAQFNFRERYVIMSETDTRETPLVSLHNII